MAEAAGLVLGAVPLFQLFKTCLEFYDQIQSVKSKNTELEYLALRTSYEHHKFTALKDRLKSGDEFEEDWRQKLVRDTLIQIQSCLEKLQSLALRHGDAEVDEDIPKTLGKRVSRNLSNFRWLASDQRTVERTISKLKDLNDQLQELIPTPQILSGFNYSVLAQAVATSNVAELRQIQGAFETEHPSVSFAAEVKALRLETFYGLRSTKTKVMRYQIANLNQFDWNVGFSRTSSSAAKSPTNLSTRDVVRRERVLALFTENGDGNKRVPVLVEWRAGFRSTKSGETRQYRLDQLVHALRVMNESENRPSAPGPGNSHIPSRCIPWRRQEMAMRFGMMPCLGWIAADQGFSHVGLVYGLPDEDVFIPVSLYEKIRGDRRHRSNPPELGARFAMARNVLERVANIAAIGWTHKSIRSHNVLFLEKNTVYTSETTSTAEKYVENSVKKAPMSGEASWTDSVYLSGFSYARPSDLEGQEDLSQPPDENYTFALYRPSRSRVETGRTTEAQSKVQDGPSLDSTIDIYGLGIILLEIALWKPIDKVYEEGKLNRSPKSSLNVPVQSSNVVRPMSINEFQESDQFQQVIDSLGPRVGSVYRDVVQQCIMFERLDSKAQAVRNHCDDDQSAHIEKGVVFLESIIRLLSQCSA
jgi:hypothetical protein